MCVTVTSYYNIVGEIITHTHVEALELDWWERARARQPFWDLLPQTGPWGAGCAVCDAGNGPVHCGTVCPQAFASWY